VELPSAYTRWRASRLGRITDALEHDLILDVIGPAAGLRVVDVGCGDGQLALLLAQAGADVHAIDPDTDMMEAARRNLAAASVRVALAEGRVEALPYRNDSFDVVLAVTVLCLVQDPQGAVTEMARTVRPGGRLILGELGRRSSWAVWRRLRGWLGHPTWRSARFFIADDLRDLATRSGLDAKTVRAAVFYPPLGLAAAALASMDRRLGERFVSGGAFLALVATKPG
jgi:ubiquinone/menaquinone biosynthesis C-methylase UbiE